MVVISPNQLLWKTHPSLPIIYVNFIRFKSFFCSDMPDLLVFNSNLQDDKWE